MQMSTLFIKLWDDFNLYSCVAPRVLRILCVALGRKSLCTTALQLSWQTKFKPNFSIFKLNLNNLVLNQTYPMHTQANLVKL